MLARAFKVEGLPTDEAGARAMFEADHKKFEMWAVGLVPAIPQEKKGADGGIDGLAYFDVGAKELTKAVIQVKGGKSRLAGCPATSGRDDRPERGAGVLCDTGSADPEHEGGSAVGRVL